MSGVVFDIYNPSGDLILSKDDTALVHTSSSVQIPKNLDYNISDYFTWDDEYPKFLDAETSGLVYGIRAASKYNFWQNLDPNTSIWVNPGNNTTVLLLLRGMFSKYYTIGYSTYGDPIKLLYLERKSLNQYSGYLDVYHETTKELVWSANSLVSAPKVLTVVYLAETLRVNYDRIELDVSKYNVDINKCYVLATHNGIAEQDDTTRLDAGVAVKQNGTKFYFMVAFYGSSGYVPNDQTIAQVFSKDGVYVVVAYMPNG